MDILTVTKQKEMGNQPDKFVNMMIFTMHDNLFKPLYVGVCLCVHNQIQLWAKTG